VGRHAKVHRGSKHHAVPFSVHNCSSSHQDDYPTVGMHCATHHVPSANCHPLARLLLSWLWLPVWCKPKANDKGLEASEGCNKGRPPGEQHGPDTSAQWNSRVSLSTPCNFGRRIHNSYHFQNPFQIYLVTQINMETYIFSSDSPLSFLIHVL
jgi:hypothetical protein